MAVMRSAALRWRSSPDKDSPLPRGNAQTWVCEVRQGLLLVVHGMRGPKREAP